MTAQEFSTRVLEVEEMLYRVAYGILLNRSDCADAVQDALLRAWEKLPTLREEQYFRTWLTRILINQCYTLLRRRRFFLPLESARTVAAPEGADRDLHDAIARLDSKLRLPIVLHYMEGYSVDEISSMLDIPSGTIKTRLLKGRKQLRAALTVDDEGAPLRTEVQSGAIKKISEASASDAPFGNLSFCGGAVAVLPRPVSLFDKIVQRIRERRKSRYE